VAVSDSRPTILVIDDEPPVRELTRRALEPEFSLLEAADGEAGLALLDQPYTTIDLVITDFIMPRIHGLAVIAALARYRPEVPIIAMTGHIDSALWEAAAKYGVRVLEKPFDLNALLASAREELAPSRDIRAVQGRRQARAGAPPPQGAAGLVAAAKALALLIKAPCSSGML
jgi:DNA-binding NtrC family response regulator